MKFRNAQKKRIVLLDYDGTLTIDRNLSELAKPSSKIHSALKSLSSLPNTYVYVLSGRTRSDLEKLFSNCEVGLSAEHGCFYRHPSKMNLSVPVDLGRSPSSYSGPGNEDSIGSINDGWFVQVDQVETSWRTTIKPLLQHYFERTPGSFIEEKEFNITWDYSNSDMEFGVIF
jgi:HAD superfamily hydrolase (TIGR01484 family)